MKFYEYVSPLESVYMISVLITYMYASSEGSDGPMQKRNLARAFTSRMHKIGWVKIKSLVLLKS